MIHFLFNVGSLLAHGEILETHHNVFKGQQILTLEEKDRRGPSRYFLIREASPSDVEEASSYIIHIMMRDATASLKPYRFLQFLGVSWTAHLEEIHQTIRDMRKFPELFPDLLLPS